MSFKKSIVGFAIAALVLSTCQFASANILKVGDTIRIRTDLNYRTGSGGEFRVDKKNGSSWQNGFFHTFCGEMQDEFIYNNEEVVVRNISLTTEDTGKNMSYGAAKLYREYWDGIAANNWGNPNPGNSNITVGGEEFRLAGSNAERAEDGRSLQRAIWKLIGWNVNLAGDTKAQDFYDYGVAINNQFFNASNHNYWGVRFMNLYKQESNGSFSLRQDQFTVIPEPGSMLVWAALGLAGFGFSTVRRRKV